MNGVVEAINKDLSAGTDLLEGLLDKKAGQDDAAGLVESVFPGAGASVLERQGRTGEVKNIDEVYTRGAVQLARLGRESPLGAGRDVGCRTQGPDQLQRRGALDLQPIRAAPSPMSPEGPGTSPGPR